MAKSKPIQIDIFGMEMDKALPHWLHPSQRFAQQHEARRKEKQAEYIAELKAKLAKDKKKRLDMNVLAKNASVAALHELNDARQAAGFEAIPYTVDEMVRALDVSERGVRFKGLHLDDEMLEHAEATVIHALRHYPGGQDHDQQTHAGGGGSDKDKDSVKEIEGPANASDLYEPPKKTAEQLIEDFGAADHIKKTEEDLSKLVSTDALVSDGGYRNPDGSYTEARAALHREIVNDILNPEAVAKAMPKEGEQPTLIMLGGRGGSGKSFFTKKKESPIYGRNALLIDCDEVKAKLPEYRGWNAGQLHEESSHILDLIDRRAVALGINVIHDATMKSESTPAIRMARYETVGYRVEGYYMYARADIAAERSMHRYSRGGKFNGRYVPPSVIYGNVNNEKNFDKLSSGMEVWEVYENNRPGTEDLPKLVSKGRAKK